MKRLLVVLIGLLILPFNVKAMAYSETFNVGDRVEVLIENDNEDKEFFVLKPSAAGETYVWLIYNGNVGYTDEHGIRREITVYDEPLPGEYEPTGILEQSPPIYRILQNATANWRIGEPARLLNLEDLTSLGITQGTSGLYEIKANRAFLGPRVMAELQGTQSGASSYNYWTEIYRTTSTGEVEVFAVTYNESYNGDALQAVASLQPYNISSVTDNYEFVVRPVVKVDKKYIDCNLSVPTTNPPTSEAVFPYELLGVLVVAAIAYVIIRKKDVFEKI